ncbi:MAG: aldehyde dehydrogenase family protein [Leptospiraceae bacterium]|nr:aldehyde dehydrogenase family protein [Leptospiraceae bacterium]
MIAPNTPVEEIDRIYALQKKHKPVVARTSYRERVEKLQKLLDTVRDRTREIHEAIYKDFRKVAQEADITEVIPVIGELNDAIKNLKDWMSPKSVDTPLPLLGSQSKVYFEPKGQALIIAPWNYPFNLSISPIIGAIAAGNTMIVKPSEYAAHTSALLKDLLKIFPEEEVAVIEGDASVSGHLLSLRYDHIFFTGSVEVGRIVMQAAAKYLTPVTLELGGKSPVIVDEYCDFKEMVKKICWGKFINCGQTCVAPDYILLPKNKLDDFRNLIRTTLTEVYGKEGERHLSPDYARLINERQFNRIQGLLNEALEKGAEIIAGGQTLAEEKFVSPTVLYNAPADSRIMNEEIFGPLLPVVLYETIDEALEYVNRKEKPLALYIFSNREYTIQKVLQETSAGGTCINDVVIHLVNPDLPFGGVGESGMGNYHGYYSFRAFSHERAVLRQSSPVNTIQLLYPPYKATIKILAKDVIKNLV